MAPELRKRKAPAQPAPPPPAKKKTSPKPKAAEATKAKKAITPPKETKPAKSKSPVNGKESAKPAAAASTPAKVGDVVNLDGFGGEVETHDGKKVTLKQLVDESKAGVVLFTYPKALTPGCMAHSS